MVNLHDKERILKAAREKKGVTYKGAPIRLATDFSMKMLLSRREWQKIFQVMRTRVLQPRLHYPARLSTNRRPNKEFPRQKKSKRIHFHQTSSAKDAKGTALRKGRKRGRERNTSMNNYLSIITLNVNGLNATIKRHRIAEWIRKHDPHICCLQETHLRKKRSTQTESEGLETNFRSKRTGKKNEE